MPSGSPVVAVTGASRGIGPAVARLAGTRGYAVAVNYGRSGGAALEVVQEIERADGRARAFQGDVSKEEDVVQLFEEAACVLGPVTALVNNAGLSGRPGRLDALTGTDLSRVLGVNAEGIRVNAVRPGLIETEIHAAAGDPDRPARLAPTVPMGRAGTAGEVAEAIVWLLSPAASYTTGAILDVGGGR